MKQGQAIVGVFFASYEKSCKQKAEWEYIEEFVFKSRYYLRLYG